MRRRFVIAVAGALLLTVVAPAAISAADLERVVSAAQAACSRSAETGSRTEAGASISGSLKASIMKWLGQAGVEVGGEISNEKWDGIQQVLREHQLEDSKSYRDCVQTLIPQFLALETPAAPSARVDPAPPPGGDGGWTSPSPPVEPEAGLCEFQNDGECDEPWVCAPGTDTADCAGVAPGGLQAWPAAPAQFCCDAFGNRWCQMGTPLPYGSTCACPGVVGYGLVCP